MDSQAKTGINCKTGGNIVDFPIHKMRPWMLTKEIPGPDGPACLVGAYFIQVRTPKNECDTDQLIAASVEVDKAEYDRIVALKQKILADMQL